MIKINRAYATGTKANATAVPATTAVQAYIKVTVRRWE